MARFYSGKREEGSWWQELAYGRLIYTDAGWRLLLPSNEKNSSQPHGAFIFNGNRFVNIGKSDRGVTVVFVSSSTGGVQQKSYANVSMTVRESQIIYSKFVLTHINGTPIVPKCFRNPGGIVGVLDEEVEIIPDSVGYDEFMDVLGEIPDDFQGYFFILHSASDTSLGATIYNGTAELHYSNVFGYISVQ